MEMGKNAGAWIGRGGGGGGLGERCLLLTVSAFFPATSDRVLSFFGFDCVGHVFGMDWRGLTWDRLG